LPHERIREWLHEQNTSGLVFLIAIAASGFLSGCFISKVDRAITGEEEYQGEFYWEGESARPSKVFGSYVGNVNRENHEYRAYRFYFLLKGDRERQLEILIPEGQSSSEPRAIVTESDEGVYEIAPSQLYVLWMTTLPPHAGVFKPPVEQMRRDFPYCLEENGFGRNALAVNFRRGRPQDARPGIYYVKSMTLEGEAEWDFMYTDVDLEWRGRSKTRYYLMHLNYIWAVPFDIVTFPFQAVGFFLAGG
jgi:hypothetical protein